MCPCNNTTPIPDKEYMLPTYTSGPLAWITLCLDPRTTLRILESLDGIQIRKFQHPLYLFHYFFSEIIEV
ncbi:hypothetical protein BRADI_1g26515v3 [Brachypodium distachyon]|uniref:Uncharacterized protein n=1 Tax=Brachypodium distachyon TaxID=15368 RepID=A0A2K2DL71_BRADI|nr:hypothetical protein BRADI_1g26515v3 [Brachypodium distachyon]